MQFSEFLTKLSDRFPDMSEPLQEDIKSKFRLYAPDSLDKIFDAIKNGYAYDKAPSVAKINKLIEGLSLRKESENNIRDYAYKCPKCGAIYRGRKKFFEAHACPNCEASANAGQIIPFPKGKIIYVQDMCLVGWDAYNSGTKKLGKKEGCPNLRLDAGSEYLYGPTCDNFGLSFLNNENHAKCMSCPCRKCCQAVQTEMYEIKRGKGMKWD